MLGAGGGTKVRLVHESNLSNCAFLCSTFLAWFSVHGLILNTAIVKSGSVIINRWISGQTVERVGKSRPV